MAHDLPVVRDRAAYVFSVGRTGNLPDGTGEVIIGAKTCWVEACASAVPLAGSPGGAGESPALVPYRAAARTHQAEISFGNPSRNGFTGST